FAEPVTSPAAIAGAVRRLLDALGADLEAAGQGARRLELAAYRSDGRVERATAGTSRSSRDPGHLARLFAEKLPLLDPGL
ncbi:DNA polymerase Y family protein, partial [Acinetobacter baumannii]